jgi:hypothetical protein
MPSKKYNGNTPLGSLRLGSLSDVELEVARRTPKQAMTTGVVQTHNGSFHTPKRRQRANTATTRKCPFLVISKKRKSYHDETQTPSVTDFYIHIGAVNNIIPTNYKTKQSATENETTTVYVECTMSQQANIAVSSAEIKTTTAAPPELFTEWLATDLRPAKINIILGYVHSTPIPDTEPQEYSYSITTHRGDLSIEEYTDTNGSISPSATRSIFYRRIT